MKADGALTRAAQVQANSMAAARTLSHDTAGDFSSRMRTAGISVSAGGENLAQGQRSLAEAIQGWSDSPPHRRNLLLPEATRFGLGRATAGDGETIYWALILASPEQAQTPTIGAGSKVPLPFGLGRLFGR